MKKMIHHRVLIATFITVIVVMICALFIWPTIYMYDYEELPAYLSRISFIEHGEVDVLPIIIRVRTFRLTGRKAYDTWINKNESVAASNWFTIDTYVSESGGIYAVKGLKTKNNEMVFSDNIVKRRIKITWPDSIKDRIESGNFGIIKSHLEEQKWWFVPAGEQMIEIDSGKSIICEEDFVGLDIVLKVENPHAYEGTSIPDAFFLVEDSRALFARFFPKDNNSYKVNAGTSKELHLVTVLIPYREILHAGHLCAVNVLNGWLWDIVPIPPIDELRKEHKKAIE